MSSDGNINIARSAANVLAWLGGITRFALLSVVRAIRRPFGFYDILYQLVALGVKSLGLASVMAVFVGLVFTWQFGEAMMGFGAKNAIGYIAGYSLVSEMVPTVLALTVGARMATGMAAELGAMKVSEQIDAIAVLGADPIKKLVVPRIVAAALSLPLCVVWGDLLSLASGAIVASSVFDVPIDYFYNTFVDGIAPFDYVFGLIKALVYGILVGLIGSYQGFSTGHGTEAVGISTTNTVVATSAMILVTDFLLTTIFLPI